MRLIEDLASSRRQRASSPNHHDVVGLFHVVPPFFLPRQARRASCGIGTLHELALQI
jgi:hypothetical protein